MEQLERRKFLMQVGGGLGGFLASPQLGILGVIGAVMSGNTANPRTKPREKRRLIRSGESINLNGLPMGDLISSLAVIRAPAAPGQERCYVVAGHSCGVRAGISVLEISLQKGRWRHDVAGAQNRRFTPLDPLPAQGIFLLGSDHSIFQHQSASEPAGFVRDMQPTHWQTALCADEFGFIEVNPATGFAVRRLSAGRLAVSSFKVLAQPGHPITIYFLAGKAGSPASSTDRLFKFTSHQKFLASELNANAHILSIGTLKTAVCDSAEAGKWHTLTTADLSGPQWIEKVSDAFSAAENEAPTKKPPLAPALPDFSLKELENDAFLLEPPQQAPNRSQAIIPGTDDVVWTQSIDGEEASFLWIDQCVAAEAASMILSK